MGGPGRLGGDRQQLLVAHGLLAALGLQVLLLTQGSGHPRDEQGDDGGGQREA